MSFMSVKFVITATLTLCYTCYESIKLLWITISQFSETSEKWKAWESDAVAFFMSTVWSVIQPLQKQQVSCN